MLSWFGEVRNQRVKMWHRAKRAAILIAVLSVPGFFIGGWMGMEALTIVFPDYYEQSVIVFSWLLFAWVLSLLASVPLTLVQVSERPLRYAAILWSGIFADLIACWILIPDSVFPAESAAIAAIIGAAVVLVTASAEAWRLYSTPTSSTEVEP